MPATTQFYGEAQGGMVDNFPLIPVAAGKGEGSLATFLPPVALIFNVSTVRQPIYLFYFVQLMPILLARVALLQRNPNTDICRFGADDWRALLIGKSFTGWEDKVGGMLLFGKEFARLYANLSERPP